MRLELAEAQRRQFLATRRAFPTFDAADEKQRLRLLAESTGWRELAVHELNATETTAPWWTGAVHRLGFEATGPLDDVVRLFERITSFGGFRSITSATLGPADGSDVRLRLELLLLTTSPTRSGALLADPAAVPRGNGDPRERLLRTELARLEHELEAAQTLLQGTEELRTTSRALTVQAASLLRFVDLVAEQGVALSEVLLSERMVLRGVALGARARDLTLEALPASGLEILGFDEERSGACRSFSAAVVPDPSEEPAPLSAEVVETPFHEDLASFCRPRREPATVADAGSADRDGSRTGVPRLLVRGRALDRYEVLELLHRALDLSVVAADLPDGLVSLQMTQGSSFDELRDLGLVVGEGPLRLVTSDGEPLPAPQPDAGSWSGPAVALSLRRISLPELLCLLQPLLSMDVRLDPQVGGIAGAPMLSLFVAETPLDLIFEGALAIAGVKASRRGDTWIVSASADGAPTAIDPCELSAEIDSTAGDGRFAAVAGVGDLAFDDLELAGLAFVRGTWRAWAFGPGPGLLELQPEQLLYDGRIVAIDGGGIEIDLESGGRRRLAW